MATVQEAGEEADNRGIQTVAGELVEVIEEDDIQVCKTRVYLFFVQGYLEQENPLWQIL